MLQLWWPFNMREDTEYIKKKAKQTYLAMINPYHSVEYVYHNAIERINGKDDMYVGIKNRQHIPSSLIKKLSENGFVPHTLDRASVGGRAVDSYLRNPITGNLMTGSSSGTAINVLLGINDLGVGTDGGGSVLAPAMAVNLFSFISKLIEEDTMKKNIKLSTDGIAFSASIGFMSREIEDLFSAIDVVLPNLVNNAFKDSYKKLCNTQEKPNVHFPKIGATRKTQIEFLNDELPKYDFLVTEEGPIDLLGIGDTVLGHFDDKTKKIQDKSNKGLIKVVNMVGATCITVPNGKFASAYVLISESKPDKIRKMLAYAKKIALKQDEMLKKYFSSIDIHFPKTYMGGK